MSTADERLADQLSQFYDDPLGYVMFSFPWDTDPAIQVVDWESVNMFVDPKTGFVYDDKPEDKEVILYADWMAPYRQRFNSRFGPDKWACEDLDHLGAQVRARKFDGHKAVKPIQEATSSGHGIGKSVKTSFLIKWIMDTRPFSRGTVTANTAEQLRTKTWAELGKWHKRSLTAHWFNYNAGRGNMSLRHNEHAEEWYCSAQTCREENSEAFAGQHAANSTSFYIFDEASAVPDKIYEVREGGTTDGEPMIFDFGNPTRNSGRFFEEVEGKFKQRFVTRKIDSRTVAITNKSRIAEWAQDYGEDSDFFKVRVRGEFPSSGSLQFMPTAWVRRAMLREVVVDRYAKVVLGVDVARFGNDNSVIYPRIGNDARSFAPVLGDGIWNGLDNVQLAQKVVQKIQYFEGLGLEVGAVFVDVTGVGSGVVDTLVHSGFDVVPVNFGTSPVHQPEVYRYRSDELWGRCRDAIRDTLVLPKLPMYAALVGQEMDRAEADTANKLFNDLTQREFGYTIQGEKISLESKKDMKARGLASPDLADSLCLTYAEEVAPSKLAHGAKQSGQMTNHDFNPLDTITAV